MSSVAWDVFQEERHEWGSSSRVQMNWVDTVFFDADCDAWYVRRSLVGHDGYDSDIQIRRSDWPTGLYYDGSIASLEDVGEWCVEEDEAAREDEDETEE